MNIKSLFLLLLLLVGFASCSSNGDDEIPEPGKASLTLKLVPQGGYGTKADTSIKAWASESKVNSFVILIFREGEGDPLVYTGTTDTDITIENLSVGDNLRAYAFVNLSNALTESVKDVKKEDQLSALFESLAVQKTDNLTMASTQPTSITLAEGNNTLNINITRLVSRIQVSSINTVFAVANNYTVQIDKLELGNAKKSSLLYTNSAAEVLDSKLSNDFNMNNQLAASKNTVSNGSSLIYTNKSDQASGQNTIPYGYVFENTNSDTPTQLLLTATLKDEKGKEISTKKFKVTVNSAGTSGTGAHKYVKRNYIYDLGLTFNDESFDMAALVVKVTVVPWGNVRQVTEVD